MENFGGLFVLAIIAVAAWHVDAYYKLKRKQQNTQGHEQAGV